MSSQLSVLFSILAWVNISKSVWVVEIYFIADYILQETSWDSPRCHVRQPELNSIFIISERWCVLS